MQETIKLDPRKIAFTSRQIDPKRKVDTYRVVRKEYMNILKMFLWSKKSKNGDDNYHHIYIIIYDHIREHTESTTAVTA